MYVCMYICNWSYGGHKVINDTHRALKQGGI